VQASPVVQAAGFRNQLYMWLIRVQLFKNPMQGLTVDAAGWFHFCNSTCSKI
jgi:hypothetical protein